MVSFKKIQKRKALIESDSKDSKISKCSKLSRRGLVVVAAFVSGSFATQENISAETTASSMPVTLSFAGEFAGQTFDCDGQFESVGTSDATVKVSEYKLYISRVRMLDVDGNEVPVELDEDGLWQHNGVALLDFENGQGNCSNGTAQTNTSVIGKVSSGEYTGVSFDIGVPFELNHVDPTLAASPMNLTSMFWNWRGGYRFMRVDLANVNAMGKEGKMHGKGDGKMQSKENKMHGKGHGHGGGRGWSLHIGSTGCTAATPTTAPSSCSSPNRIQVKLEDFDAETDTLVVDPANVLSPVDVTTNTPETPPGCMSSPRDPECSAIFTQLGLDAAQGDQQLIYIR